jgi:glycosyltransferase involved in cell wall biosynthesis
MMPRLLLNGRFLRRPVTGVERLALELGRALRTLLPAVGGGDITVIVPTGTQVEPTIDELGSPRPPVRSIGRLFGHVWEQVELRGVDPQAWLLDLCNTGPIMRRRQALVICDAQFVLHPESYSRLFRWWYRILVTLVSRRADAVFTISEFSKTSLERHHLVPRGKAHVLRLGVDHLDGVDADPGVLARHDLARRPYILAIGSLARHKNLATLLDAFVAAELPDVDLVIAGGSNPRIFQSAGLREAPNIRYTGRVSDGELKALYAHALAFACPSLSEGFGFTPLEAMTAGCPVVATTGGAVPEVCGDAALYADPLDRNAWRDALRTIVADQALRSDLAQRAQIRSADFVWRETARQMLIVLARCDGNDMLLSALQDRTGN